MPDAAGVGFVDVGTGTPGTDSRQFTSANFVDWASVFYQRLVDQMRRASSSIGCDRVSVELCATNSIAPAWEIWSLHGKPMPRWGQ